MEEAAAAAAAAAAPSLPSHSPRVRAAPVRVVARICPGGDPAGSFQVAARVPDPANSSSASVSFVPIIKEATPSRSMTPHKQREHKLDWCYLKDDSDRDIFQNEVKHLVDNIFCSDECNHACVVTCGSTTKTQLGLVDHPGLLTMAMERILDCAKPIMATVSVSSYQVLQDSHVFDLLEPKDREVLVQDDADGRTHLKGLSKVGINSIQEFQNLSYGSNKVQNPTKASIQARGHHGFIIFISGFDQNGRECSVGKMHFLDLADYINNKQKSHGGGFAQPNSKKSLYAVMDVVQALNSHQSFIPYRKSKITHILQDSLCKTSGALLITCLDEVSCQDAISTLSLASRSSQVVNEQYDSSLITKGCSKSNVNLSVSTKSLSRSLLPSIQQRSSVLEKPNKTQLNNSAVKATQALNANKRSETSMHSAKKTANLVSASVNLKNRGAILRRRNLFFPTTNPSKEDKKGFVTAAVMRPKEVETSICMEIQGLRPIEEKHCDTKNSVVSPEMQVVPCSIKELISSDMKEEECNLENSQIDDILDHSSSDIVADNLYADLGMTCSSNATAEKNPAIITQSSPKVTDQLGEISNSLSADLGMACSSNGADKSTEKNPAIVFKSSPKVTDRLREISNSLKLLNTMTPSIVKQKTDIVCAQPSDIAGVEPKTPETHLKLWHAQDPQESLKACSTGIKKSLAKECLSFINSASKEQLKSLKGIGEKRANFILELREESPEPLKEIDDLRSIIGMNKREIDKMMSAMVLDSETN